MTGEFFIFDSGKGKRSISYEQFLNGLNKEAGKEKNANLWKLFNIFDKDGNGTIDTEIKEGDTESEASALFGFIKGASGEDNLLEDDEISASLDSLQKENPKAELAEIQPIVADFLSEIASYEEHKMPDGGKEVVTKYTDGTTETIAYYPDGEMKYKKTEKIVEKTYYEMSKKTPDGEQTLRTDDPRAEEIYQRYLESQEVKPPYYQSAPNPDFAPTLFMMQDQEIRVTKTTVPEPSVEYELSERAQKDIDVKKFLTNYLADTNEGISNYIDMMGIGSQLGSAINTAGEHLWTDIKRLFGSDDEYNDFLSNLYQFSPEMAQEYINKLDIYRSIVTNPLALPWVIHNGKEELSRINVDGSYERSQDAKAELSEMDKSPEMYFKEYENYMELLSGYKYNAPLAEEFCNLAQKYQFGTALTARLDKLEEAKSQLLKLNTDIHNAKLHGSSPTEGQVYRSQAEVSEQQFQTTMKEIFTDVFGDEKVAELFLQLYSGEGEKNSVEQLQMYADILSDIHANTTKMLDMVLEGESLESIATKHKAIGEEIYGSDFSVAQDLPKDIENAMVTGGYCRMAVIIAVSILITHSPIMSELSTAAETGVALNGGRAAEFIAGISETYGPTVAANAIRYATSLGLWSVDVGTVMLDQITDGRDGVQWNEVGQNAWNSAKFIGVSTLLAGPLANAVSQRVAKLFPETGNSFFKASEAVAEGQAMTRTASGANLFSTNITWADVPRILAVKGSSLLTDIGVFTGLEILEGNNPLAALTGQAGNLAMLRLMSELIEFMLGAQNLASPTESASYKKAIEKSGVNDWQIKEISETIDGKPSVRYEVYNKDGQLLCNNFTNFNDVKLFALGNIATVFQAAKSCDRLNIDREADLTANMILEAYQAKIKEAQGKENSAQLISELKDARNVLFGQIGIDYNKEILGISNQPLSEEVILKAYKARMDNSEGLKPEAIQEFADARNQLLARLGIDINAKISEARQTLGIADDVELTEEVLKKAYQSKAREAHSDITHGDDAAMQDINAARDFLKYCTVNGSAKTSNAGGTAGVPNEPVETDITNTPPATILHDPVPDDKALVLYGQNNPNTSSKPVSTNTAPKVSLPTENTTRPEETQTEPIPEGEDIPVKLTLHGTAKPGEPSYSGKVKQFETGSIITIEGTNGQEKTIIKDANGTTLFEADGMNVTYNAYSDKSYDFLRAELVRTIEAGETPQRYAVMFELTERGYTIEFKDGEIFIKDNSPITPKQGNAHVDPLIQKARDMYATGDYDIEYRGDDDVSITCIVNKKTGNIEMDITEYKDNPLGIEITEYVFEGGIEASAKTTNMQGNVVNYTFNGDEGLIPESSENKSVDNLLQRARDMYATGDYEIQLSQNDYTKVTYLINKNTNKVELDITEYKDGSPLEVTEHSYDGETEIYTKTTAADGEVTDPLNPVLRNAVPENILEGGIDSYYLTEVAPFAQRLEQTPDVEDLTYQVINRNEVDAGQNLDENGYPSLSEIDKYTRVEDINQANLNLQGHSFVDNIRAQQQVSDYLDKLLEMIPDDLPEVDINVIKKHADYILPDGTVISRNFVGDDGELYWNSVTEKWETKDVDGKVLFWIRDISGKEHVLPAFSPSNVIKARKILAYLATIEPIPYKNIIEKQEEVLKKNAGVEPEPVQLTNETVQPSINSVNIATHLTELIGKPDFIENNPNINIAEFSQYIEKINFNKLFEIAPKIKDYTEEQLLTFLKYHYKDGTETFSEEALKVENLYDYLAKNYLTNDKLDELLTVFPLTDRNIGEFPKGWVQNGNNPTQTAEIRQALEEFRQNIYELQYNEGDYSNKHNYEQARAGYVKSFEEQLQKVLGKTVSVEYLGRGKFGFGFKISVDGSDDVVMKVFMYPDINPDKIATFDHYTVGGLGREDKHGQWAEIQRGPFLNENSDDFSHFYFGKVSGANDTDGYMVTEFLPNNPVITDINDGEGYSDLSTNPKYTIEAHDAYDNHNIQNGKILDYGDVEVSVKMPETPAMDANEIPYQGYYGIYTLSKNNNEIKQEISSCLKAVEDKIVLEFAYEYDSTVEAENNGEYNTDYILSDGTVISKNILLGLKGKAQDAVLLYVRDVNGKEYYLCATTPEQITQANRIFNFVSRTCPMVEQEDISSVQQSIKSGVSREDALEWIKEMSALRAQKNPEDAEKIRFSELEKYKDKPEKYITVTEDSPEISGIELTAFERIRAKAQGVGREEALKAKKTEALYAANYEYEIQANTCDHIMHLEYRISQELSLADEPIEVPYGREVRLPDGTTICREKPEKIQNEITQAEEIFLVTEPDGTQYRLYQTYKNSKVSYEAQDLLKLMGRALAHEDNAVQPMREATSSTKPQEVITEVKDALRSVPKSQNNEPSLLTYEELENMLNEQEYEDSLRTRILEIYSEDPQYIQSIPENRTMSEWAKLYISYKINPEMFNKIVSQTVVERDSDGSAMRTVPKWNDNDVVYLMMTVEYAPEAVETLIALGREDLTSEYICLLAHGVKKDSDNWISIINAKDENNYIYTPNELANIYDAVSTYNCPEIVAVIAAIHPKFEHYSMSDIKNFIEICKNQKDEVLALKDVEGMSIGDICELMYGNDYVKIPDANGNSRFGERGAALLANTQTQYQDSEMINTLIAVTNCKNEPAFNAAQISEIVGEAYKFISGREKYISAVERLAKLEAENGAPLLTPEQIINYAKDLRNGKVDDFIALIQIRDVNGQLHFASDTYKDLCNLLFDDSEIVMEFMNLKDKAGNRILLPYSDLDIISRHAPEYGKLARELLENGYASGFVTQLMLVGQEIKDSPKQRNMLIDACGNEYFKAIVDKYIYNSNKTNIDSTDVRMIIALADIDPLRLADFKDYIDNFDKSAVTDVAPITQDFNDLQWFYLQKYHFLNGTTEFTTETLSSPDDFTAYLTQNYLTAKNLTTYMSVFPSTNRNVGSLPESWLTNVSANDIPSINKGVQDCIDNFRASRDISAFETEMSNTIGKKVQVKELASGVYGTGYKISVEGSEPVVLKLFFKQAAEGAHGAGIEPQTGLFLNENSDEYVHMYFGRVAMVGQNDGYLVTQFVDNNTVMIQGTKNDNYRIVYADNNANNVIAGMNIDFGDVRVYESDGITEVETDIFKAGSKNPVQPSVAPVLNQVLDGEPQVAVQEQAVVREGTAEVDNVALNGESVKNNTEYEVPKTKVIEIELEEDIMREAEEPITDANPKSYNRRLRALRRHMFFDKRFDKDLRQHMLEIVDENNIDIIERLYANDRISESGYLWLKKDNLRFADKIFTDEYFDFYGRDANILLSVVNDTNEDIAIRLLDNQTISFDTQYSILYSICEQSICKDVFNAVYGKTSISIEGLCSILRHVIPENAELVKKMCLEGKIFEEDIENIAKTFKYLKKTGYKFDSAAAIYQRLEELYANNTDFISILQRFADYEYVAYEIVTLTDEQLTEFNEYIQAHDKASIELVAPVVSSFVDRDMFNLYKYHYLAGTDVFTVDNLTLSQDLTNYLSNNYLSGSNLTKLLAVYPNTDRNIGTLPQDWVSDVPVSEGKAFEAKVRQCIETFRDNKDIEDFENAMSNIFGKQVTVKDLGKGAFGRGYKISMDGCIDVVLKIFLDKATDSIHGAGIEPQMGLFANENSDEYVHMYFGRVAPSGNSEGYLVTQFLGEGVVPIEGEGNNPEYVMDYTDNHAGNIRNGKNIDFGGVKVKRADGKATWDTSILEDNTKPQTASKSDKSVKSELVIESNNGATEQNVQSVVKNKPEVYQSPKTEIVDFEPQEDVMSQADEPMEAVDALAKQVENMKNRIESATEFDELKDLFEEIAALPDFEGKLEFVEDCLEKELSAYGFDDYQVRTVLGRGFIGGSGNSVSDLIAKHEVLQLMYKREFIEYNILKNTSSGKLHFAKLLLNDLKIENELLIFGILNTNDKDEIKAKENLYLLLRDINPGNGMLEKILNNTSAEDLEAKTEVYNTMLKLEAKAEDIFKMIYVTSYDNIESIRKVLADPKFELTDSNLGVINEINSYNASFAETLRADSEILDDLTTKILSGIGNEDARVFAEKLYNDPEVANEMIPEILGYVTWSGISENVNIIMAIYNSPFLSIDKKLALMNVPGLDGLNLELFNDKTFTSILNKTMPDVSDIKKMTSFSDIFDLGRIPVRIAKLTPEQREDFDRYISTVDLNHIKSIVPGVEKFSAIEVFKFLEYSYKSGRTEFTSQNLNFPEDLTMYLSDNYLDDVGLTQLLCAYPATDRNIGSLPENWMKNIAPEQSAKVNNSVRLAIDNFIASINDKDNKDSEIQNLQDILSDILGQKVTVSYIGHGAYKRAFKISLGDGSDVVLCTFFNNDLNANYAGLYGMPIEPQVGMFLNNHSNADVQPVHMFFGKVSALNNFYDGYYVTQFVDHDTTPIKSKIDNEYKITFNDNFINGKENGITINGQMYDYDFGGVDVKDKDGNDIRIRFLDEQ